jgi:hypothetical protein
MRFMVMHKVPAVVLDRQHPTQQRIMREMPALIQEGAKAGVFTNGAGLHPTATRTRLTFKNGELTRRDGPYAGTNELLEGFFMVSVKSKDEAIGWVRKLHGVVGDLDLELGLVTEPWDLGFGEKPAGAPERYLLLMMSDEAAESGSLPSEKVQTGMGALLAEMGQAKVLQAVEGILPSKQAKRLGFKAGQRTSIVDGPFAESKELIGGFCLIQLPGWDDAVTWATRYGSILGEQQVEVRQLHDVPAFDGR